MTRRRLLPRLVFAGLLVAVPAVANAPADQYEQFDNRSTSIIDHYTRLEWDRFQVRKGVVGSASQATCASIFPSGPAGRAPTIKELLTILDETPTPIYENGMVIMKMIDENAFPSNPVDYAPTDAPYWSSTPANASATQVWTLNFTDGTMKAADLASTANLRCVRNAAP